MIIETLEFEVLSEVKKIYGRCVTYSVPLDIRIDIGNITYKHRRDSTKLKVPSSEGNTAKVDSSQETGRIGTR